MNPPIEQISELQFNILDAMADDAENIEQIYLWVNTDWTEHKRLHVRYLLHIVIDEIKDLLERGYIKPEHTHNPNLAPLDRINDAALHYYWFAPTDKGKSAWRAYLDATEKIDSSPSS